jgi:hypothetical protein
MSVNVRRNLDGLGSCGPDFVNSGKGVQSRVGVPQRLPSTAPGGERWSPRPPTEAEREALDRPRGAGFKEND